MSAPLGDEPPGETSESCVKHERYRRCKRGEACRTKGSHWGNPGRQSVFCEARVRRPAHADKPSPRVTGSRQTCFAEKRPRHIQYAAVLFFMLVMRIFSYVFHCIRNSEWKPPTTGDERVGASSTPTPEPESTRGNAVCPIKSVVSIFGISLLLATFYNTVSYVTSRNGNRIAAESGRFGPARFWFRF